VAADPTSACEALIGRTLPAFSADSSRGRLELGGPHSRGALVLLFLPCLGSAECREYVAGFVAQRPAYEHLGARVVLVTAATPSEPAHIPYPVITHGAELFSRHGLVGEPGGPTAGVIIVDRYGAVASCYTGTGCADLPAEPRVRRAVLAAEAVCPECGVPEDHWLDAVESESG